MKNFYNDYIDSNKIYNYVDFMKSTYNDSNSGEFVNYIELFNIKNILHLSKDEKFIFNNLDSLDKSTYTLEFNEVYMGKEHPIELLMYTFTNTFTKISFLVAISDIEKDLYAPEFKVLKKDNSDEFYLSLLTSGLFKLYVSSTTNTCYIKPVNIDITGSVKSVKDVLVNGLHYADYIMYDVFRNDNNLLHLSHNTLFNSRKIDKNIQSIISNLYNPLPMGSTNIKKIFNKNLDEFIDDNACTLNRESKYILENKYVYNSFNELLTLDVNKLSTSEILQLMIKSVFMQKSIIDSNHKYDKELNAQILYYMTYTVTESFSIYYHSPKKDNYIKFMISVIAVMHLESIDNVYDSLLGNVYDIIKTKSFTDENVQKSLISHLKDFNKYTDRHNRLSSLFNFENPIKCAYKDYIVRNNPTLFNFFIELHQVFNDTLEYTGVEFHKVKNKLRMDELTFIHKDTCNQVFFTDIMDKKVSDILSFGDILVDNEIYSYRNIDRNSSMIAYNAVYDSIKEISTDIGSIREADELLDDELLKKLPSLKDINVKHLDFLVNNSENVLNHIDSLKQSLKNISLTLPSEIFTLKVENDEDLDRLKETFVFDIIAKILECKDTYKTVYINLSSSINFADYNEFTYIDSFNSSYSGLNAIDEKTSRLNYKLIYNLTTRIKVDIEGGEKIVKLSNIIFGEQDDKQSIKDIEDIAITLGL